MITVILTATLVFALMIGPVSAVKPTHTPTPTPTITPDPDAELWAAIETMQGQIAALQTKVDTLETENAALEARVAELESGNTCIPAAEVCDEIDNDCDGTIDEGDLCGDGECQQGVCTSELSCPAMINCANACENDQGCILTCYMSGSPEARDEFLQLNECMTIYCNTDDPDCITTNCNEEYEACMDGGGGAGWNLGMSCTVGTGACESEGVYIWNADQTATICNVEPAEPGVEGCDGIDNDCDGSIDEGSLCGSGQTCAAGACVICIDGDQDGITTCDGDCDDLNPNIHPGVEEICDTIDNNCDGEIDGPLADEACGAGMVCNPEGNCLLTCGDGFCNYGEDIQSCPEDCTESSDDTDGDGIVDLEDNCLSVANEDQEDTDEDGLGDACDACPLDAFNMCESVCGDGICASDEDSMNCAEDCLPSCTPTNDGVEICDDIDNDCDGIVDDEFNVGASCEGVGACSDGIIVCNAAGLAVCSSEEEASVEVCDEIDNDCDGLIDEDSVCGTSDDIDGDGVANLNDNCLAVANADQADSDSDGLGDACDACPKDPDNACVSECGDGICDADEDSISCPNDCPTCTSTNGGVEICDGIDNNCNGVTDEGSLCASVTNGLGVCNEGTCSFACNTGFGDCDLDDQNGCEIALATSTLNCGACGNVCSVINGLPGCISGTCVVGNCNAGFGDCDGSVTNGCEIALATSTQNCGSCGNACSVINGQPGCSAGACTIASCNAGFADCDLNFADGCETQITSNPENCGACGSECTDGQVCVNSVCTS
jgi:hypothetical protein